MPGELIEHQASGGLGLVIDNDRIELPRALKTPGNLVLLRALHALHGREDFKALLYGRQGRCDRLETPEQPGAELRQALGTVAVHILTLVDLLGGVEREVLDHALRLPQDDDVEPVQMLIDLGLLEPRGDRVEPGSFRHAAGVLAAPSDLPESWMRRMAVKSLDRVTDPDRPGLEDAGHVFRAHRLFVALGDVKGAMATTREHVGGLVALAADLSRAGEHRSAFGCYDHILSMWRTSLRRDWVWYERRLAPHLHSYVLHYRAYNGARAEALPAHDIKAGYQAALDLWSDNALWHGRLIGHLFGQGQVDDAWSALRSAENAVRSHTRRDWALRVLPARSAIYAGLVMDVLRLVTPLLEAKLNDYGTARDLQGLLITLECGVEVDTLAANNVRLVFHRRQRVLVQRLSKTWKASLPSASALKQAALPADALTALVCALGDEARALVQTPSHRLSDGDLQRKGQLIGLLELLNSDLGLRFAEDRWLVGRVDLKSGDFTELHREQDDRPLSAPLSEEARSQAEAHDPHALWFARVATFRDGSPRGEVLELEAVGSGRTARELFEELRRLSRLRGDEGEGDDEQL